MKSTVNSKLTDRMAKTKDPLEDISVTNEAIGSSCRVQVTLKRYQVRDLFTAIKAMDGVPEIVKDESSGKHIGTVNKPYKFSARLVYCLAKTRELLKAEVVAFEEAQEKITKELSKSLPNSRSGNSDRLLSPSSSEEEKTVALESLRALAMEPVTVEVIPAKLASFNLEENRIPPSTLSDLFPMIEEED